MNQNGNTYQPPVTEDELITLLRAGDKRGMEALYDMYAAALFGVVFKVVRSQELAEDIVHDAFMKIWRTFGQYDKGKGRLFTWLVTIARNLALDTLRSGQYKTSQQNRDDEEIVRLIDAGGGTTHYTDGIGLRDFIEQLKPEQRQIIDLVYFQGCTQAEAAEELGIPLGTVKTRMRAATATLKTILRIETQPE